MGKSTKYITNQGSRTVKFRLAKFASMKKVRIIVDEPIEKKYWPDNIEDVVSTLKKYTADDLRGEKVTYEITEHNLSAEEERYLQNELGIAKK